MKKICIAGKNSIAVEATKHLLKSFNPKELCVLLNETDTGENNWQPSLKYFALNNNIDIYSIERIYEIKDILLISLEYDKLLLPQYFKSKRLYNIHFSLLPKYKGQFTSTWPILNCESKSGVTLHKIDTGIDTGPIIDQESFDILEEDTAKDVYSNYLTKGLNLFLSNFDKLLTTTYSSYPQPTNGSTFYSIKSIDFKNIKINFRQTAYQVKTQIRAFCFREYQLPYIFNSYVYRSEILNTPSKLNPGTLLTENNEYLICATIDYDIKIFKDYYYRFFEICSSGSVSELEPILMYIPNLEEMNNRGWTGLMIASFHGNFEIAKYLVSKGAI